MQFPPDLDVKAFHARNGERAWRRPDALAVARLLASEGLAILGGELWLIRGTTIIAGLRLRSGETAVYHWSCERASSEAWAAFVERSGRDCVAAIEALPGEDEVDSVPGDEIYYNLTWIAEDELQRRSRPHSRPEADS